MNTRPMLMDCTIVRGSRPYDGPIVPGSVFAWEPDLPHARDLVVVCEVCDGVVTARSLADPSARALANDESRFREAVLATRHLPMPATAPHGIDVPLRFPTQ